VTDLRISSLDTHTIDRRAFLLAGLATVIGANAKKQSPSLETFTQWSNATLSHAKAGVTGFTRSHP
jgi:hypothetical protein